MSDNPTTVPEWMATLARANIRIAELEATIDRLKCCGNCKWIRTDREYVGCHFADESEYVDPWRSECIHTPSRWAERGQS